MNPAPLDFNQRLDWLRLARTSGVGPVTFFSLLDRFRTPACALEELPRLSKRGGRLKSAKPVSRDDAAKKLDHLDQLGGRLLCAGETGFPVQLRSLDPPPPVISVIGPLDPDARPACAIVGSRNASAIGIKLAGDLAKGLGEHGVTIVSGLARGIDGAAHAASLDIGTIAVIAGGLGRVYPPEHGELQHAIAQSGLIVSESPPDYSAQARDFPERNRLIAGLGVATLVVEAAERSGSLITARFAGEMGREVMAIPGSPLDPRAKGTNRLLRDGAALIETVEDVLEIIAALPISHMQTQEPDNQGFKPEQHDYEAIEDQIDTVREKIASKLSPVPIHKNEIIRQLDLPSQIVSAALVELELAGRCQVAPGGLVYLTVG